MNGLAHYNADTLKRLLDLRPGESEGVLRASTMLFGLVAAHTVLETARDTLFLTRLEPQRLTVVYALLAVVGLVAARWNVLLVRRVGSRSALIVTLMVVVFVTTLLHGLVDSTAAVFGLYVWTGLAGMMLVMQFWVLAGAFFNVAQGKRLFGFVAAGGGLGAIAGASLAALLLQVVSTRSLLLVAAVVLLLTAMVATTLPSSNRALPAQEPPRTQDEGTPHRGRRYVRLLVALAAVSTACLLTTDYAFKTAVAESIPASQLGTFFAVYYAVINGSAFLAQMLLSGWLVRRVGVVVSMAILPLGLLAGALGLIVAGGLVVVLLVRSIDGTLRHSLHRVSSELLWMPLPDSLRIRAKGAVDTVVVRVAQALTAGVIMFLAWAQLDTIPVLGALISLLGLTWMTLALAFRRPYLDLFRRAISRHSMVTDLTHFEVDVQSAEIAIEALSSRDPRTSIAAMELLTFKGRRKLIPSLILYHESDEVVIRALQLLPQAGRNDWIPLAERLLTHPNEGVRAAAVRSLAAFDRLTLLPERLNDISPAVRAHAAFSIANAESSAEPHNDPRIRSVLSIEGEASAPARNALLDAICARGDERWTDVVLELARDRAVTVDKLAEAMNRTRDPRNIPVLIAQLAMREGREAARVAIVAHEDEALEALEQGLRSPETPPPIRLHIPRTVSRFASQRAVDTLLTQLEREHDGAVRYKILRGLGHLAQESSLRIAHEPVHRELRRNLREVIRLSGLRVGLDDAELEDAACAQGSHQLLRDLVTDKIRLAFERGFRLLKLLHRHEDLRGAHAALLSKDLKVRANALEFLTALTMSYPALGPEAAENRELLRIVADDLPDAERVKRARAIMPSAPISHDEALLMLMKDADDAMAAMATHHARELDRVLQRGCLPEAGRRSGIFDSLEDGLQEVIVGVRRTADAG